MPEFVVIRDHIRPIDRALGIDAGDVWPVGAIRLASIRQFLNVENRGVRFLRYISPDCANSSTFVIPETS